MLLVSLNGHFILKCAYFQRAWVANNSASLFVTILCAGGCNILHSLDDISVNNVHCQRDSEKRCVKWTVIFRGYLGEL